MCRCRGPGNLERAARCKTHWAAQLGELGLGGGAASSCGMAGCLPTLRCIGLSTATAARSSVFSWCPGGTSRFLARRIPRTEGSNLPRRAMRGCEETDCWGLQVPRNGCAHAVLGLSPADGNVLDQRGFPEIAGLCLVVFAGVGGGVGSLFLLAVEGA